MSSEEDLKGQVKKLQMQVSALTHALEERRAEASESRAMEEKLGFIAAAAKDAIIMMDSRGAVSFWNPAAEKMFGYSEEQALGRMFYELLLPERMRPLHFHDLEKIKQTGKSLVSDQTAEMLVQNSEGVEFPCELSVSTLKVGGDFWQLGIFRDIRKRKEIEESIRRRAGFETLIAGISSRFVSLGARELGDGINEALRSIGMFSAVDRSHVILLDEDGSRVWKAWEWVRPGMESTRERMIGVSVDDMACLSRLVKGKKEIHIPCIQNLSKSDGEIRDQLSAMGIKSLLAVPLIHSGITIGCLGLESIASERDWRENEIRMLKIIGEILVSALDRSRTEEALRESANRLMAMAEQQKTILEYTSDFVYRHDTEGVFNYMSPSVLSVTGYSAEEWLKHYSTYMTDNPINEKVYEYTEETLRSGKESPPYLVELFHKDGRKIIIEVNERPYRENGKVAGIVGVARDVTERLQTERQLVEHRELLSNVISTIPLYVFWKDRSDAYMGCNDAFARVAGLNSPQEIVGKNDHDLAWRKEEADFYRSVDAKVMETGESILDLEEPQLQADGKEAILLTSKTPLRDKEGNVFGVLGIFADITDRKRLEEELKRRRESLEEQVEQKTAELRKSNQELQQEITDRKQTEEHIVKVKQEAEFYLDLASHDLTNFNQTILGNLNLLRAKSNLDEKMEKYVAACERQVAKSENLIAKMRAFSQVKNIEKSMLKPST